MKKLSLLLVLLVFSMTVIMAQTIAEYTFTTSTDGTLQDMTGSSTFTNLTPGTYYDDTASTVTNIGFTFGFGLGAYTQFSVNSNGQMQLGATAISGGSASPAANTPRLAPFSGDNSIQTTGKVHYLVTGSAPNRKLVVEWLNLRVPYTNDTTGTYCTMQAWLYEGSNNIKFVYGTMWNMSTSAASRGVYVSTSNVAGSLGQVTDIIGTMTWNNSATSITNTSFPASSAMANLNSAADGSRRVFSINYPVYTTPPNVATLLSPSNGAFAMVGDALTWQSGGGGATSYDVYFGTTNPPAFIQNQGASSYTPTLAAGTTYYWNIVARNASGAASPTATWSFQVPGANNLVESFESTSFPPAGWANPGTWSRSTSYYKNGVASAYKYGSTSTQYILSTPKVTITGTSVFNLWTLCSSTTGTLQIVYSPDRTTWTQIGSNITHAVTYTWYNTNVDLSSLAGNNYYLGVRTGLQSASFYTDMYIGPVITPEAPGAPALSVPADLATAVSEYPTLTWTAPVTGGIPTGYRMYLGTTNPPTTMVTDQMALTYTYTTPLAFNTTYYWTVEAYNTAGTGPQATVRSFTTRANPLVSTFPYSVDFSTFLPTNWAQYSYLYGGTPATGGSWIQDDWLNVTTPVNKAAKINIYTSSQNSWVVTPPIQIPATGYELKFDLALMAWNSASTPVTAGNQGDDRFLVVISNNPNMTDPTTLMVWNNTGSANVYDNIPAAGGTYTIDLDGYVGTKYIGFYAESVLDDTGDNDLMIDNVIVRETPSAPVFTYTPSSIAFGTTFANTPTAYQNVTITNTGTGTIDLTTANFSLIGTDTSMFSYTTTNLPASLGTGQSVIIPVRYNPNIQGNHSATLRIVYNATNYDVALTGNAVSENALFESFEGATYPPADWTTQPTAWESYTGYYHTGTKATKAGYSTGTWWLMTPLLSVAPGSNSLSFWYRDYSSDSGWDYIDEYTYVMVSTAGNATTDFTTTLWTGDYTTFTTTWQQATIDLSAYNGQNVYIAFKSIHTGGNYRIIDDVFGPDVFVPSGPPEVATLTYPADGATGLPQTGFDLTWTPASTGGVADYYAVYLSMDEGNIYSDIYFETTDTSLNPTTFAGGPSPAITFNYLDRYYWTVEAVNGDGSAVVEPAHSFEIQDDPTVALPYTQDFGTELAWPTGWTQMNTGAVTDRWAVTDTNNAGGTSNEMTLTWVSGTFISRLISPPINTSGVDMLAVNFKQTYDGYAAGITAKVQYSHDLTNWFDSPWTIVGGTATVGPNTGTALITGLASPVTWVSWTLDGNHFNVDYWYVDDVTIQVPPAHDVAALSYDTVSEVVPENTLVTPLATVGNNGINTETFTVTCTIGTYTDTQTVTGLAMGTTQQVTFTPLTPALWSANNVVVTTNLATDSVAGNNTVNGALICLDLDTPGLANNANTDQFVSFNLATPGTATNLTNTYSGTYFIAGADWMNGAWMGVEYDDGTLATDNYYNINPITGVYLPSLGEPGVALMGNAWDDTHSIMYAVGDGNLYTMDPATGLATLAGTMWFNNAGTPANFADINGLMIDIAYDNTNNVLYGIDLGNDCLWTIDPATYEVTFIGYLGIDLNYAQDAAFDQENGLLFLAGYAGGGALYWIDTTYGGAYKVGNFPSSQEYTAFAIPYGTLAAGPVATISGAGVLSWDPVVGAVSYNVYSSNDPYGTFTFEANVLGTTYTGAVSPMKFYKVTALGGRSISNRQPISYSTPLKKAASVKNNKPNFLNVAR